MNRFSERLKELRIEKGQDQRTVAKNIGLSQSAIAQWENNKRTPNADAIIVLADYFDVTTDYLLGRVDIAGAKIKP